MIKKITLALFFAFAGLQAADAQVKIGYANYGAIMDSLPEVRAISLEVLDLMQQRSERLKPKQDTLSALYTQYEQATNAVNPTTRQQMEAEIVRREDELEELTTLVRDEVRQRENTLMSPIRAKVDEAIQTIAGELGLNLILNERQAFGDAFIYYSSSEAINITEQVLERIK